MRLRRQNAQGLARISFLLPALVSLSGCLLASGKVTKIEVLPVPAQRLQLDDSIVGGLANIAGLTFPFSDSMVARSQQLEGAEVVRVAQLALRTTLGTPEDHVEPALTDPALVTECRPGQEPITWVRNLEVRIARVGEPDSETWLARHEPGDIEGTGHDMCGFFLTVNTDLNLVDYLPSFRLTLDAQAGVPDGALHLGGFSTVMIEGRFRVPSG